MSEWLIETCRSVGWWQAVQSFPGTHSRNWSVCWSAWLCNRFLPIHKPKRQVSLLQVFQVSFNFISSQHKASVTVENLNFQIISGLLLLCVLAEQTFSQYSRSWESHSKALTSLHPALASLSMTSRAWTSTVTSATIFRRRTLDKLPRMVSE